MQPETILASGTTSNFGNVDEDFQSRLVVNHGETLAGPNGERINNGKAFFARLDSRVCIRTLHRPHTPTEKNRRGRVDPTVGPDARPGRQRTRSAQGRCVGGRHRFVSNARDGAYSQG
jgi:hypothetical protein